MRLIDRLRTDSAPERSITSIDDYIAALNQFAYQGVGYGYGLTGSTGVTQTLGGTTTELAANNFVGLASQAYGTNGVVFACMLVRQLVFSSARFRWQRIRDGKPSDMFGNADLGLLERPWVGGTTQDLLSRMIQYADLAGNAYVYRDTPLARLGTQSPNSELVYLRPDWVDIVVEPRIINGGSMKDGIVTNGHLGYRKVGYIYTEGGLQTGNEPVGLLAEDVAHFAPIPDPLASFRGMSWLTPILREIQADHSMTRHKRKFFDNGATPNMIVKHLEGADRAAIAKWAQELASGHAGTENAYKTLHLYPGADATVVGSDLKAIDYKEVQGAGETRIAAAAGVPPIIVGLSEGLAAATYANYGQARRRLADGTAHPLWQNLAGSIERVIPRPRNRDGSVDDGVRLWYDANDVPFLREDEKDAAEIQGQRAMTINTLITAGFKPDSVITAVDSGDFGLLQHSGLVSVQLLPPGTTATPATPPVGGTDDNSG